MAKLLKDCLQAVGLETDEHRLILRVSNDSRECDEASIYVGEQYREEACKQGAYVVGSEYLGALLRYFYDDPSAHYKVIGVTGTNGKTTVTYFLKQMLTQLGYRCIRLGTQQNEFEEQVSESVNTTMNVMENLKVFCHYIGKIDYIIMEVSSHAIEEGRVAFIRFDRLIYTNITPEHLDYHKTFTHYQYSKFKLRHSLKEDGRILFHYDQHNLRPLLAFERERVIPYGIKGRFQIEPLESTLTHVHFRADHCLFKVALSGEHTMMNLGAVLACLSSLGIALSECVSRVAALEAVPGRMEIFEHEERIIVIDYAHTPASLEAVCLFLRMHATHRLICVFGCGGQRDREKRKYMAKTAFELCDEVIVTEDNNRNEDFSSIIEDMQLERFAHACVIEKRKNAVHQAFNLSKAHDIILLAGKGNEKFLIANGVKTAYNDKACISECKRG